MTQMNPMKTTEQTTAHTPGPWSVNIPPHKFPIYAKHATNRFCYVAVTPRDDGISDEEKNANARLIAAAPDLLEWMSFIAGSAGMTLSRKIITKDDLFACLGEIESRARAAIARATQP